MSLHEAQFEDLVAGIVSNDQTVRDEWAEAVEDYLSLLSEPQAKALARVLATAALEEPSDWCREAQLNALAGLAGKGALPDEVLALLRSIDPSLIHGSMREHLADLLADSR